MKRCPKCLEIQHDANFSCACGYEFPRSEDPSQESKAAESTSREVSLQSTFNKRDHVPFLAGVFILGGLLILPAMFQVMIRMGWFPRDDDYGMSVILGLLFCVPFAYATNSDNCEIGIGRLILGFVLLNLFLLRSAASSSGVIVFVAPGVLALAVLYFSGWAGAKVGRAIAVEGTAE